MNELAQSIEALLFALGRPVGRAELASKLNVTAVELNVALNDLRTREGGIVVVDDGAMVELRTSPHASSLIERVRKEEYDRDIGKAGLEALAAILYRGPLTRSEIDFIRGVNSSQTLRTLTLRGLVRKIPNPKDERSYLYEPTTDLLSHLGVSHADELPEFNPLKEKLRALEESYKQHNEHP